MDPLVATLESVPIVMEEPQPIPEAETTPVSPVDKVLALPELLAKIFGPLAEDSDLESLKNVRLVCKLWKKEAFSTFKAHLSLLPWIVADEFMSICKYVPLREPCVPLESCADELVPGSGFPLKLIINEWSPNVATFIRDFACDIVCVMIVWPVGNQTYFEGFEEELKGIELPALEEASIAGVNIWECNDGTAHYGGFVKALTMWKQLLSVSNSRRFKSRNIQLKTRYFDDERRPLLPSNSALKLIEWSKVNSLGCTHDIFVSLTNSHKLSALRKLAIYSLEPENRPHRVEWNALSLEKVAYLKELTLEADENWELNHPMNNLTSLKLRGCLTITANQPVFTHLPNLKKVEMTPRMENLTIDPVSHLTSGGGGFINVVQLKIMVLESNQNSSELRSFPNLKTLEWESPCELDYTRPLNIWRMEFLTRLKVRIVTDDEEDVVKFLTGVWARDMPDDEDVWPTALVDKPHSITNLRHLKSLHLSQYQSWRDEIVLGARNTRFLFTAAFRTMETLEHLRFHGIVMDTSCATQWEQMGKKITHTLNEDWTVREGIEWVADIINESAGIRIWKP